MLLCLCAFPDAEFIRLSLEFAHLLGICILSKESGTQAVLVDKELG